MIDIHTHILPGIDDGANDMEEAIAMLTFCAGSRTNHVVMTPHANIPNDDMGINKAAVLDNIKLLREEAKARGINVNIYSGMEVYATYDIREKLYARDFLTLNNTRYLLIEFPFEADGEFIDFSLHEVMDMKYIPVIAHPERYTIVRRYPEIAYEWNKRGIPLQVNSGSIQGIFGKSVQNASRILLENNLVQFIASDAHDTRYRRPGMRKAYKHISEHYSRGYADILLRINPRRLLLDKDILIINPRIPRNMR